MPNETSEHKRAWIEILGDDELDIRIVRRPRRPDKAMNDDTVSCDTCGCTVSCDTCGCSTDWCC